ncbi:hypothetical protein ABIB15_002063 [Marisediminicola sp. UYEF4]|uniref:hypothetical protein n=1 Tax=Marisediminicola sp. UYEF4 TaxID=1756384 RepID=UPI0033988698
MDHPFFRSLRQAQVIKLTGEAGLHGDFIVVSQSCDVVQPKRELLQLAPLVSIPDAEVRRGALKKVNPRYPLVSAVNEGLFADLARLTSVEKRAIVDASIVSKLEIADARDAREFGLAVGRWFSRFAFPDEVQPWLAPVQELIRKKYDSSQSALGRLLQDVTEIRVEAPSWDSLPVAIKLHVIVKAGVVPTIPEDQDLSGLGHLPNDLDALCQAILNEEDVIRRAVLWSAFPDALAQRCSPKGRDAENPAVRDAVDSVEGELSSDDTFSLSSFRRSEQLDIDFLSDPMP